ncbi:MAG: hypothetical protein HXO88_01190 [Streptococcus intermedius]|uniref:Uncharacterized protein n=1 Tax=Streptococcus intermedius TaxID=1338 RepID=A0A930RBP5_STRIT|nr:hypothetical protein [Streptococcus intermedius]
MNKISSKLSRLTNKQILKLSNSVNIILLVTAALSIAYSWYKIIVNDISTLLMSLLLVIAGLAMYSIFINIKLMATAIEEILTENIDLEKYLDIYTLMYKKANRYSKEEQEASLIFTDGRVKYYRGQFQDVQLTFDALDYNKVQKKYRTKLLLRRYNFEMLSCILQKEREEYNRLKSEIETLSLSLPSDQELRDNILKITSAAYSIIVEKQPNNYFDTMQPQNKLERITYTYYAALNAQLKGEEARTRELFESIAQENSELFYVQEAKRYLKGEQ